MITPAVYNYTGYIGSTFDSNIILFPTADSTFTWVGAWSSTQVYAAGVAVIGSDNNAYAAYLASSGINPVGATGSYWSTPLSPLNINGCTALFTMVPVTTNEYTATPTFATPLAVYGLQGSLNMHLTPSQTANFTPGSLHYFIEVNWPTGDMYYYVNGSFTWLSP